MPELSKIALSANFLAVKRFLLLYQMFLFSQFCLAKKLNLLLLPFPILFLDQYVLAFLFFRHFDLDGELGGPMYQLKFDIAERERER